LPTSKIGVAPMAFRAHDLRLFEDCLFRHAPHGNLDKNGKDVIFSAQWIRTTVEAMTILTMMTTMAMKMRTTRETGNDLGCWKDVAPVNWTDGWHVHFTGQILSKMAIAANTS
jgi:hypothetical protein